MVTKLQLAENGIRDMFLSEQYHGKVPIKDMVHILHSPRWNKFYGDRNVRMAWIGLVDEDYVRQKGKCWVWVAYNG
jgi:hypothetical protein